jgi:very-short-patch-repair endonuclease
MERDNEVNQQLRAAGWTVLRFWDIDINKSLDECINTIIEAVLESKVSKEY